MYLKQKHPLVILTHDILEHFILYYLPLFYSFLYQLFIISEVIFELFTFFLPLLFEMLGMFVGDRWVVIYDVQHVPEKNGK